MYMANYWRRFFNIDEVPENDQDQGDNTEQAAQEEEHWIQPDHSEPGADPEPMSHHLDPGHQQVPRHLIHMALVLDSVFSRMHPSMSPMFAHVRERMASGTLRDFSSLNAQELTELANVLAITAHQLAREATPDPMAHEVELPQESEDGL